MTSQENHKNESFRALGGRAAVLWVLAAAGLPGVGAAQMPDLVDLQAQYTPSTELRDPRPTTAQLASYEANLNLPLVLGRSSFLVPGLSYRVEAVSFADAPPGFVEPPRAYHAVDLPLLFVQLLPKQWSLSLRVAPGLAADAPSFEGELLRVSGLVLATRTFSEQLVAGGGGLVSYTFGELLPLPALYVDYRPSKRWRIESFLPAFLQAGHRFGDRVELSARAEVHGNSFGIRDASIADAYPCVAAPADDPATPADETEPDRAECLDHVAYSLATVGAVVAVRVVETLWLSAFLGHTVYRRFETLNADNERTAAAGGGETLPNQLTFRMGATLRLPQGP